MFYYHYILGESNNVIKIKEVRQQAKARLRVENCFIKSNNLLELSSFRVCVCVCVIVRQHFFLAS